MTELTDAEKTFFTRMAFHIERGMDFKAAGEAVLADDVRLTNMALANDGCGSVGWNDQAVTARSSEAKRGDEIRSHMAATVYRRLRLAA